MKESALKLAAMGRLEEALNVMKVEGGLCFEKPGKKRVSDGVPEEYKES